MFAAKTVNVFCPCCEATFTLKYHPVDGQIIICSLCHAELEVVREYPLKVVQFDETSGDDDA